MGMRDQQNNKLTFQRLSWNEPDPAARIGAIVSFPRFGVLLPFELTGSRGFRRSYVRIAVASGTREGDKESKPAPEPARATEIWREGGPLFRNSRGYVFVCFACTCLYLFVSDFTSLKSETGVGHCYHSYADVCVPMHRFRRRGRTNTESCIGGKGEHCIVDVQWPARESHLVCCALCLTPPFHHLRSRGTKTKIPTDTSDSVLN